MRHTYIRGGVLAAVLLASSIAGHAATVSYSLPIFGEGVLTPLGSSFPTSVNLDKFYSGYGTLQSVSLKFEYAFVGEVTILNYSATSQPFFEATATVPLTITGNVGLGAFNPTVSGTAVAAVGPSSLAQPAVSYSKGSTTTPGSKGQDVPAIGTPSLDPNNPLFGQDPGWVTYKGVTKTGELEVQVPPAIDLPAILAAFTTSTAGSTFKAEVKTTGADGKGAASYYVEGNSGVPLFVGGNGAVGGKVTVTYTYIPAEVSIPTHTPEPMTTMLVGSAVLGLGVMLRRRNNKTDI